MLLCPREGAGGYWYVQGKRGGKGGVMFRGDFYVQEEGGGGGETFPAFGYLYHLEKHIE
jgi:hypothetical protein